MPAVTPVGNIVAKIVEVSEICEKIINIRHRLNQIWIAVPCVMAASCDQ